MRGTAAGSSLSLGARALLVGLEGSGWTTGAGACSGELGAASLGDGTVGELGAATAGALGASEAFAVVAGAILAGRRGRILPSMSGIWKNGLNRQSPPNVGWSAIHITWRISGEG